MCKEFDVNELTEVFIEMSDEKGQFTLRPLEKKLIVQSRFDCLLEKATKGCGRPLCTFKYCQQNPWAKKERKILDTKQFSHVLLKVAMDNKNIK